MQYIKVRCVRPIFWYGILVLNLLVFPFCLMADQHDTISEAQEPSERQNQVQTPATRQNTNTASDSLSEGQGRFQYTVLIPILGILFLGILTLLIMIFLTDRSFRKQVGNRLSRLERRVNALSKSPVNRHSQTVEDRADYSKDLLSDFKRLFEMSIEHNRNIQQSLERMAITLENHNLSQDRNAKNQSGENTITSTDSQEITAPSQDTQPEQDQPLSQVLQVFCDIYNNKQEDQLQINYQPSYRIQVSNTLKRREDPSNTPIFETNERGKFWAFYIEDEKLYAVVPVYGLILERSVHGPGGFSVVFECPGFDFNSRYKNLRVIKPGIFEPDFNRQSWTLIGKGQLDLGSSG